jgi:hypothetical protein
MADVVFVVDSTASICSGISSCPAWDTFVRRFIRNVVGAFSVDNDDVRVGLVTYSTVVDNKFFLTTYSSDKTALQSAVSSLIYTPGAGLGTTALPQALSSVISTQFTTANGDRLAVPNIVIVLTNSDNRIAASASQLHSLRREGVLVYAVGMSTTATSTVVGSLVQPPSPILDWNYFLSPGINSSLVQLANSVSTQVCLGASSNCEWSVMDLVFVVPATDSVYRDAGFNVGYWSNMMNFIADLVDEMNLNSNVRVGLVGYGDFARVLIPLDNGNSQADVVNLIRGFAYQNFSIGHNIQVALTTLRMQAFIPENGDRSDVPNVAVIIADQSSSGGSLATLSEAKLARQQGIRIHTIGAASLSRLNVTELQLMSSRPRLEYHQWWRILSLNNIADIKHMVETELCRPDYGNVEEQCRYTAHGGFQCFCPWGWCDTRPLNGTTCVDVNECASNNGGCTQGCSNSDGSYGCYCSSGFELATDMRTCLDINECLTGLASCAFPSVCINTYGNYYCLSRNAIVASSLSQQSSSSLSSADDEPFSSTIIGLSVSLAVVVTVLVAGVLLTAYLLRRARRSSAAGAASSRYVSGVQATAIDNGGYGSVRSKYSNSTTTDSQSSDDVVVR